ncbi:hypothetical protein HZZ13_01300 [Bradyrhizobium sp. CNPSo 4010]|uniref:Uncharacterized protein n=1 Tax=Bradyrhizobium agreste TaxID=2751811 RepID=A0ABS0PGZ1_9BRAD|nr:hypothetical protein [Bradyrhizobium agreste]MBH5396451.1 hypothetical protein [Bradyrhizobium agreste]
MKITANRSDEEIWRIERLEEVRDSILDAAAKAFVVDDFKTDQLRAGRAKLIS